MSLQFRDKDVVRDSVKCLAQVQGFISCYSTKQIPEEAKVCSPEVQSTELAVHSPRCPKDLEFHHFMVTAAKAALELHIPYQLLPVGENKVQHSTIPHWLLYHLEKEIIINTFQEPPGLLMPCCVVPLTDIGLEKTPSGPNYSQWEELKKQLKQALDIQKNPILQRLLHFAKAPIDFNKTVLNVYN
ncbi:hypothetical protein QYF61_019044 [Mycteria americana]|uniref:Uncharacterized protein n=1 Tax=Mycteria americana TaxID=33587 RepID=A0AAN7RZD8_MYCAM|nr:hypothetical protein QYF61_019044 [Mycteria americana]